MGPNYDNGSMDSMLNVSDLLDYETIPYLGEKRALPVYEVVLKVILFTVIIIIALVGNLLIIVSVIRQKQMQTTTNFYIANLAVADLLVTIFCTWVHLVNNLNNNNWVLGRFFCKFNTFSQGKRFLS
ncbi:hypothetical protein DPMN_119915 [Dreissena polymorpha]|uniref:G-protein coupled receptors family 1 profile domain-containing protein n=1 Tax=Dreissena polymorpha TaxID=45954 RepID=A0A9D4GIZ2_DREPO|nr:hypothetical protein DPMN_119915 [Dreissena polymorpha]